MNSPRVKQEHDGKPIPNHRKSFASCSTDSDRSSSRLPRQTPSLQPNRGRIQFVLHRAAMDPPLTIVPKEEPGEIDSSPTRPFPRALYEATSLSNAAAYNGRLTESSGRSHRRISSGPVPQQGTPQDRFRQAILGLGRKHANAARSGSSGGWHAPFASGDYYPSPNHVGGFGPSMMSLPAAASSQIRATPTVASVANSSYRPSPIQTLSRECQRRGFNPAWHEMQLPNGSFTCNVRLQDRLIRSNKLFKDPVAAKTAVAKKAIRAIWTGGNKFNHEARFVVREFKGPNNKSGVARASHNSPGMRQEKDAVKGEAGNTGNEGSNSIPNHSHGAERITEPANLLDQVCKALGISEPGELTDGSEATRAFLEGLAVGARLAESASRSRRSRSRSPPVHRHTPGRYRDYSERSLDRSRATSPIHWPNVTGDRYDGGDRGADSLTGDYYDRGGHRGDSLTGDYYNGGGRRDDSSRRSHESRAPARRRMAHSHFR
ncbi:hypothetical protein MMYC01_200357 [Madurella mycetomatis]|uniref:Uncharacterized protein n=1 Tax=Madurella mycetomatis TaxID=100816 RepID=A0A175WI35_9PEZI|nr:hypothetical protein MMYC01_200357 [Madurella mycetomatis]